MSKVQKRMAHFPVCIAWRSWWYWFLTLYWRSCYKLYSFCFGYTVCTCSAECHSFGSQLIKKFPGCMKFRAHLWTLFWARWILFTLPNQFCLWHLNILYLLPGPPVWDSAVSILYAYIICPVCATFHTPFISLDFNIPRSSKEYRLWSLIMNCFPYIC
jgi:hypothetical protein